MNNSSSAKNGFKTFILTLSVSLIVFSVVYYFISESQSNTEVGATSEEKNVQSLNTQETDKAEESVFKKIADAKSGSNAPAVLAGTAVNTGTQPTTPTTSLTTNTVGTDAKSGSNAPAVLAGTAVNKSTGSAVPDTGVTEITVGLLMSALSFAFGLFVISKNPRKIALSSFEKKMTKGL